MKKKNFLKLIPFSISFILVSCINNRPTPETSTPVDSSVISSESSQTGLNESSSSESISVETRIVNFYADDKLFDTEEVEVGSTTKALKRTPSKDGYIFVGWFANLTDTMPYDFNQAITTDLNLYAKFRQDIEEYEEYLSGYDSLAHGGVYYEILGEVNRNLPTVSDGGLTTYPIYNQVKMTDFDAKQAVYDENLSIMASDTTYNSMDKDGNLYLNGTATGNKLFKHSASIGLFGNSELNDRSLSDVKNNEMAVIKKMTVYDPKPLVNYLTGLYAPAGEVIKINIPEEYLASSGGFTVMIGVATSRNNPMSIANVDWNTYTRMPIVHNKFDINTTEAYVGSPLGGPIYITPKKPSKFEVTISGAVEYLHYIDGITTEDEFNRLLKTSAPYFDAETYDLGVRFSGPRYLCFPTSVDSNITPLSFDNLKKTMKLWEQFNLTSNRVPKGHYALSNITMFFDVYIQMKGASAVAIVGRDYSNLPISWMRATLDYDSFMMNGAWGPIHEFNHHYQKFGANGNSNEVTNNVVNYIEYMLYTRVTEYRNYSSLSHGLGLNPHYGIEYYNQYLNTTTALNTENGYGLLLQNIGAEAMINVAETQGRLGLPTTPDGFYESITRTLHMDFTYLIRDLWHLTLSDSKVAEMQAFNYPKYVPVGSYYASSFKYLASDGSTLLESKHALPYIISPDYTFDLVGDINAISGYNVKINRVENPQYGTLTKLDSGMYRYVAKDKKVDSFDVYITISNGSFSQDIVLTYSFNPINENVEQKTYTFGTDKYTNIEQAYDDNFEKATSVNTTFLAQGNSVSGVKAGTAVEITGKILIEEDGPFEISYIGGRGSSMLYASINNEEEYHKIGYILINQSGYMFGGTAHANSNLDLKAGDELYYKMYLLATSDNAWLQIGISRNQVVSEVRKINDNLFKAQDAQFGQSNKNLTMPNVSHREYSDSKLSVSTEGFIATSPNFVPWDNMPSLGLDKIFDNDDSTYAHSQRNVTINATNYVDLYIEAPDNFSFTTMTLVGVRAGAAQLPTTFDLYASFDGENYTLVNSYQNLALTTATTIKLEFDEVITAKYLRMYVTKTSGQYFGLKNIIFDLELNYFEDSIDNARFYGNVVATPAISTWGHNYQLKEFSYMKYEFEADSITLGLDISDGAKYVVYVDDEVVELEYFRKNNITKEYIVSGFEYGKHELKIVVETGIVTLDKILFIDSNK